MPGLEKARKIEQKGSSGHSEALSTDDQATCKNVCKAEKFEQKFSDRF